MDILKKGFLFMTIDSKIKNFFEKHLADRTNVFKNHISVLA